MWTILLYFYMHICCCVFLSWLTNLLFCVGSLSLSSRRPHLSAAAQWGPLQRPASGLFGELSVYEFQTLTNVLFSLFYHMERHLCHICSPFTDLYISKNEKIQLPLVHICKADMWKTLAVNLHSRSLVHLNASLRMAWGKRLFNVLNSTAATGSPWLH